VIWDIIYICEGVGVGEREREREREVLYLYKFKLQFENRLNMHEVAGCAI
jgi:hypothetical protein